MMTFEEWWETVKATPGVGPRESYRAAWDAATERCAMLAHGHFLAEGPPVSPLGSHLAVRRAAGAEIAARIREGKA